MLKVFSLVGAMFISAVTVHDFHASITQIDVNAESKRLEVAVKLFTNDIEAAIQPLGQLPLQLGTAKENERTTTLLSAYLTKHLAVHADAQPVALKYIGKETEADATWCYFESEPMGSFSALTVTNTLLLAQFDDQVNIIHLNRHNRKQAKLTNAAAIKVVFD